MQNKYCPICSDKLKLKKINKSKEFSCNKLNHFFAERFVNEVKTKLKIRVNNIENNKFFYKIHYDKNNTELWHDINDMQHIIINSIMELEKYNVEFIENKIKIYSMLT